MALSMCLGRNVVQSITGLLYVCIRAHSSSERINVRTTKPTTMNHFNMMGPHNYGSDRLAILLALLLDTFGISLRVDVDHTKF